MKKYFYCWLGEFNTNNLGLFFNINFLYFVYKKFNFDSFVLGMLQIDNVFLFYCCSESNYEDKKSPKYFIFLFKFMVLRMYANFSLLILFSYFLFAYKINCYCENFLLITYFSMGGIHVFCVNFTGYEMTILSLGIILGDDLFKMLSTLFSIICRRIAYLTLKSNELFSTISMFYFSFLDFSNMLNK